MIACRFAMLTVALFSLLGCQTPTAGPAQTPTATKAGSIVSAEVLRRLDYTGLQKDDELTVTTPKALLKLTSFFPALGTTQTSSMHANWTPWVIIRLHKSDGSDLAVGTDYRLYRVGEGDSGDFVIGQGFHEYIDQIYNDPSLVDRSWVKNP